jgi:hypothetical protein
MFLSVPVIAADCPAASVHRRGSCGRRRHGRRIRHVAAAGHGRSRAVQGMDCIRTIAGPRSNTRPTDGDVGFQRELIVRESPSRRELQRFGGAHDGVVGTQGLASWMDVAMTRLLGRRTKPITAT